MPKRLFVFLIVIFHYSCACGTETYVYDYSENCNKAYQYYLSLNVEDARACIIKELQANPYNLMATYISDYEDCILLLLNCDKEDYKQRAGHLEERINLLEKGDESSPWYRFCKSGIYLHWAIVNMRFGEQYSAALKFHKSFALLKDNQRLFPQFEYNNTFAGLEEAVVGALPGSYKWLASIFGMKGNVKKGTELLAKFVATHTKQGPMYSEAVLYYLYTRFYLLQEQEAVWQYLISPSFSTENNMLNLFVKASIAIDYRKSDEAIDALKNVNRDARFKQYPFFYYLAGVALLNKTDDNCKGYFLPYLVFNKSELYIKDTWQRLAINAYIHNDTGYLRYCVQQIKNVGTARIDADKQAEKFAEGNQWQSVENSHWPNKSLLRSRLLIEGGYYKQAYDTLTNININTLTQPSYKVEYYFRFGRVYEESGDNGKALQFYRYTINTGKNMHEQFAARAALQMGKIYEHTGRPAQAIQSYKECLDMPEHDFQNSIDQQAKAGINRMEAR